MPLFDPTLAHQPLALTCEHCGSQRFWSSWFDGERYFFYVTTCVYCDAAPYKGRSGWLNDIEQPAD